MNVEIEKTVFIYSFIIYSFILKSQDFDNF